VATIKDIVEFCESQRMQAFCDAALKIIRRHDSDFSESDHPRDNEGKFSESGGGGSKLTPTEKTHLSSYSGDDFLRVNKELRSGNSSDPSVRHIESAISKSALSKGTTVYRGMTREAARQLFPGGEIKKGETISDPAFLSTSKSQSEAHLRGLGGVVLKIEAGENAKGLDMTEHSRNPGEKEILLPRNAKLKVVGLTEPKSPTDPVIVRLSYGD
jgi:hypothetical protein